MIDRDPYPDVPRAPYALPEGVPPLQEDPDLTRRKWLGVLAASWIVGAAGGYFAGRWSASSASTIPSAPNNALLTWARRVADGPVEVLLTNMVAFLAVAESHPGDRHLHVGIEKLVECAEANPELEVHGISIGERLARTQRACGANLPAALVDRMIVLDPERSRRRPR